uniref:retinal rod rhodopsin-sensitive cGMP 3',5'-cyclic phosphodiesterase subunit gamma-like n=1 Tax=Myxine glutinosa TaxID=7769 RepID=UPI00358E8333
MAQKTLNPRMYGPRAFYEQLGPLDLNQATTISFSTMSGGGGGILAATKVVGGPITPRKGPCKFKQRQTRQFKSKPPKKGIQGFGDDIPGMEGLGTDITVICPWEAFSHLELHELAQFGIV